MNTENNAQSSIETRTEVVAGQIGRMIDKIAANPIKFTLGTVATIGAGAAGAWYLNKNRERVMEVVSEAPVEGAEQVIEIVALASKLPLLEVVSRLIA